MIAFGGRAGRGTRMLGSIPQRGGLWWPSERGITCVCPAKPGRASPWGCCFSRGSGRSLWPKHSTWSQGYSCPSPRPQGWQHTGLSRWMNSEAAHGSDVDDLLCPCNVPCDIPTKMMKTQEWGEHPDLDFFKKKKMELSGHWEPFRAQFHSSHSTKDAQVCQKVEFEVGLSIFGKVNGFSSGACISWEKVSLKESMNSGPWERPRNMRCSCGSNTVSCFK